mmetsp:Transcript_72782/g.235311  ORF Transcript_72782/g.235311 Transcript_72782/m.235311 type:complete len:502 (-) Transcript_72782:30-1535(-)
MDDFDAWGLALPAAALDGSVQSLGAEGMQRLQDGCWEEARDLFARAVLLDAGDAEALFRMGLFNDVAHQHERMLRWMDATIESHPGHVLAWNLRSKVMENQGRLQEALQGYEQVLRLAPENSVAAARRQGLLDHQAVYIMPAESWMQEGAADVLCQVAEDFPAELPDWQENFLRPTSSPVLQQPLLSVGVAAWDNVLSQELLCALDSAVDHFYNFTFTNGWVYARSRFPGIQVHASSTVWLPSDAPPVSAPELAARCILERVLRGSADEYAGIEYWGRVRSVNLGASLHYDQPQDAEEEGVDGFAANPWRPEWSSVLYLTDEGGPTVILDQISCEEELYSPNIPLRGHVCMPRRNRLVVFRGDLFHGQLPEKIWHDTSEMRRVFVFNFWKRHTPEAPHCQRQDLSQHPAAQHMLLRPDDCRALEEAEARPREALVPVPRTALREAADFPHSSDFNHLQLAMPMPSMERLKETNGLYELDWAVAAKSWPPVMPDRPDRGSFK